MAFNSLNFSYKILFVVQVIPKAITPEILSFRLKTSDQMYQLFNTLYITVQKRTNGGKLLNLQPFSLIQRSVLTNTIINQNKYQCRLCS